ncbi:MULTISPECIES: hypothetical protein [unclassified Paenibacillus]|uniref:hypothetical protein n=1 Tax=unclassified Paenibacillus TaxID=185978 RepID=UPI0008395139|nr:MULTISPECIES: hypothetical protein [unclassified Paenibacillus]NWL86094.1 hypothetical protein [Paenibacillus sp. 79R4]
MKNFAKFLSILFAAVIILSGCSSNNAADSKKLSSDEKLALSYVTDFYNGTKEDREKFVEESVHPEIQALFRLGAASEASEDKKLKDPKVAESVPYDDEDGKGAVVLIQAANHQEMIVLIIDNKVAFGYAASENAESQELFDQMRSQFKAAK